MKEIVMSYKYITMDDRNKIEVPHEEGYSARKIVTVLAYYHSSISRELKRCANDYKASNAHLNYLTQSKNKGRKYKLTHDIKESIEKS